MFVLWRNALIAALLIPFLRLYALDFERVPGGAFADAVYQGVDYALFVAPAEHVRLMWQNSEGENYRTMRAAGKALEAQGKTVALMMNAGIFSKNGTPAGLWIEHGTVLHKLNTAKGKGNFHIEPNGVFYLRGKEAGIVTTSHWQQKPVHVDYALQSGPMLLIDGKINPRFLKNLSSSYKRNAVCITRGNALYFIITTQYRKEWPNFYHLAQTLQAFGCYQALYLDGALSDYYLPGKSGWFHWKNFVGMIVVTTE